MMQFELQTAFDNIFIFFSDNQNLPHSTLASQSTEPSAIYHTQDLDNANQNPAQNLENGPPSAIYRGQALDGGAHRPPPETLGHGLAGEYEEYVEGQEEEVNVKGKRE